MIDRGWTRPGPTPDQRRHDLWLGLGTAAACVGSVEVFRSATGADVGLHGVEGYLLFAVAGAALALRRMLPLSVLLLESALFIVIGERLEQLGITFTIQIVMFAALYAAWAWSTRTRALLAATGVVLAAMFGWLVWALLQPEVLPTGSTGLLPADVASFTYSLAVNVVYFGGAIAWGQAAYGSARRNAELDEQQVRERARRSHEQELAVRDERVRIARDLHDVVAHHISSIGVQAAGAGRVLERDSVAARSALATIESSSRRAVAQMQQLVGLLRSGSDDAERAPQPGLADVASLVPGERPAIEHRVVGDPFEVPATVQLSLYRIAQEAVTNTRRHAGARQATLVVRYVAGTEGVVRSVEVEMLDDGRGTVAADPAPRAGGYGLRGIAERAALHDGQLDVGPRPQGGWRVRVRVPVPAGEGMIG